MALFNNSQQKHKDTKDAKRATLFISSSRTFVSSCLRVKKSPDNLKLAVQEQPNVQPTEIVVIGAGSRGANAYASYALRHPDEVRIVGVAEPDPVRRQRVADLHDLDDARCFATWEDLLDAPAAGRRCNCRHARSVSCGACACRHERGL